MLRLNFDSGTRVCISTIKNDVFCPSIFRNALFFVDSFPLLIFLLSAMVLSTLPSSLVKNYDCCAIDLEDKNDSVEFVYSISKVKGEIRERINNDAFYAIF